MWAWGQHGRAAPVSGTIPPLSIEQREQLATAGDRSPQWDEAALYPLLRNVLDWPLGSEQGATVPDYAALHTEPGAYRGELFLIEGVLAGPPRVVRQRLARAGPWEDNLQQWDVLVRREPDEVVIVLLVDPMPAEAMPQRGGRAVRLAGRFFKVLDYVDRQNQPTRYLVFVGRSVKVAGDEARGPESSTAPLAVLLILVVLLLAAWMLMRRVLGTGFRPRPLSPRLRATSPPAEEDSPPADPLPSDPIEALEQLRRRREQDNQGGGE